MEVTAHLLIVYNEAVIHVGVNHLGIRRQLQRGLDN